jgi:3-oxoacyl-[acyl-carrier protein] reductase
MAEKRVLVTGSSRGIGRAIALKLADQGWHVAIHYGFDAAEANSAVAELGNRSAGLYQADLGQPDKAAALVAQVLKDGPLQAVVNNAGVYIPVDFASAGDAVFAANLHKTFAVNFESPLAISRAAVRHFASHGGGKVLNVCSRVGFRGEGGAAIYAASKAALINLTRSLAVELAPRNIQTFAIAPGWVDTAMARDGMQQRLPEILSTIPLNRMATPADCAAAAGFLLSDEAAYLSGIVIDINGASYFH